MVILITLYSCMKEKGELIPELSDNQIFLMTKDTSGYQYLYHDPNTFLSPAGGSPHGIFKLRFNKKAQSVLDGTGKLPVNSSFPDSSLIVKDAYDVVNGNIILYAIMYKLKGSWSWAEYQPDGKVSHSIFNSSSDCISCHNASPNRDQARSFDLH